MTVSSDKVFKAIAKKAMNKVEEEARPRGAHTFTIDDELYNDFKKHCATNSLTMSHVLDALIAAYLEETRGK